VHNYIEPKLQRDYISDLPKELILLLLTYVRPKDLYKLAQVSHYWHQIANDPILWKNICKKFKININLLTSDSSIYEFNINNCNNNNNNQINLNYYLKSQELKQLNKNLVNKTNKDSIGLHLSELKGSLGNSLKRMNSDENNEADGSDGGENENLDEPELGQQQENGDEKKSVSCSLRSSKLSVAGTSKVSSNATCSSATSSGGSCSPSSPSSNSSADQHVLRSGSIVNSASSSSDPLSNNCVSKVILK
jgi:hypothetical protein